MEPVKPREVGGKGVSDELHVHRVGQTVEVVLIGNKQVLGFGLFGGYGVQIVVDAAAANAALPGLLQSGQYLLRLKVRKIQVLGQLLNRLRRGISFYKILDAKIATSVLFLAKENKARQTGLGGYKSFITQVLGGPPWEEARKADCSVLTFNYDRLLEIALLELFPTVDVPNRSSYVHDALNSGFDYDFSNWSLVQPTPSRFSLLKMHGSAGWWVKVKRDGARGERCYWPGSPVQRLSLEEVEKTIPRECSGPFGWKPLLAFPHERQESQEYFNYKVGSSNYGWAPYIDAVWQHAASIVATATEVRVIGYSFNPIDSRYMVNELLSKVTCDTIVVQNKNDVRRNLESYRQFKDRLEYDPTPFGE